MTTPTSIRVLVGSTNPVKIGAAKAAFEALFPSADIQCRGLEVPSGVAHQPMTVAETRLGAINRVRACAETGAAFYYVAMEGGADEFIDGPATFAYVAILGADGQLSVGRSSTLPLPPKVFAALKEGEELGHVMDRLFNTINIKQAGGAIGLLTNNAETRESSYRQALVMAMAPLLHPELYQQD